MRGFGSSRKAEGGGGAKELLGEALLLSRIEHPNIVRIFYANTLSNARGAFGFSPWSTSRAGAWSSFGTRTGVV